MYAKGELPMTLAFGRRPFVLLAMQRSDRDLRHGLSAGV
jgi:hypothetical protein